MFSSLKSYVSVIRPSYQWYRHCEILANALERVERGEIKRLMVFMPPRYGKSELVSRIFPAYYLGKHPERSVGLASYTADLAHMLARNARENFIASGRPINPNVSATREWETHEDTIDHGGMWSAGVGGGITGRGFNLGIIDDPYKDLAEALSSTIREGRKDWYRTVWLTRREPAAAEILVMTRWYDADLAGWLFEQEQITPEHWHILAFDEIHDDKPFDVPRTCTVEPDWRNAGEVLCPERFQLPEVMKKKLAQGERFFGAMSQQRPHLAEGEIWKAEWFKVVDIDGLPQTRYADGIDWDTAYTENEENAATGYVRSCEDTRGNMYVTDAGFEWREFPKMIEWMKSFNTPHYVEAKASGKSAVQTLIANGIAASEVEVQGDKQSRTILATPFVQRGNVFILRPVLDKLLNDPRQGILHFPKGAFRELNDAFVQAINRHFKNPAMTSSSINQSVITPSVTAQSTRGF